MVANVKTLISSLFAVRINLISSHLLKYDFLRSGINPCILLKFI